MLCHLQKHRPELKIEPWERQFTLASERDFVQLSLATRTKVFQRATRASRTIQAMAERRSSPSTEAGNEAEDQLTASCRALSPETQAIQYRSCPDKLSPGRGWVLGWPFMYTIERLTNCSRTHGKFSGEPRHLYRRSLSVPISE